MSGRAGTVPEVDHPSPVDMLVRVVATAGQHLYRSALVEAGAELANAATKATATGTDV